LHILLKGEALIDNSFVTGEATPVKKQSGDRIFAGGKQLGEAIELEVIKAGGTELPHPIVEPRGFYR
jgi:cation transport ATPase